MKLTIIYDNEVSTDGLKAEWGFSCMIESEGFKILFDTGGNGVILLENMKKLNIDSKKIDNIFISHGHWDHMGGLSEMLFLNQEANVYLPSSCLSKDSLIPEAYLEILKTADIIPAGKAWEIHDNIYSTGELGNIEQSLIINTEKGLVIVVGCAHSGMDKIISAASNFGKIYAVIGGLHGFNDFKLLKNIELICPTHCTKYRSEIVSMYPDKCIDGGVGRIIEI